MGGLTGSLSASGSHMERIGAMRDNLSENASTMALAGASITGSLSGSAMVNCFNRSVTVCMSLFFTVIDQKLPLRGVYYVDILYSLKCKASTRIPKDR